MAWHGYFTYGGKEVINGPRALSLARTYGLSWVRQVGDAPDLQVANSDSNYSSVVSAPWFGSDPASSGFFGVIPLEVDGIESSTLSASVTEGIGDGGVIGSSRNESKEVTFSVALIGFSAWGIDYGLEWLKRTLAGQRCTYGDHPGCSSGTLRYYRVRPDLSDPLFTPANRMAELRGAALTRGPQVTGRKQIPGCSGWVATVTFTMATQPFEYSDPKPILANLNYQNTNPYASGVTGSNFTRSYTAVPCATPWYDPVYDPECLAFLPPPTVPSLEIGCLPEMSGSWSQTYASIEAQYVHKFSELRPIIGVNVTESVRNARVAFYEAVPTNNCANLVGAYRISYIPPDSTLTIDSTRQESYIADANNTARNADTLVYGGTGIPPTYFGISCNKRYRVALEMPDQNGRTTTTLSLSLTGRTA